MTLRELNALGPQQAAIELRRCCGSSRWAASMAAARPFASLDAMVAASDRICGQLEPSDWLEAFAAHPRIGERSAGRSWSSEEQASVATAADDVQQRLATANHAYERRFGYIYIVCATGKSATEMLTLIEQRLRNNPEDELRIAAAEQRQITRLRLAKLLA